MLHEVEIAAASNLDAKPVTVADLLTGSPAGDWRAPNPDDTLYLELARGRVLIELATQVAPQHVANLKTLVRNHFFDGLATEREHAAHELLVFDVELIAVFGNLTLGKWRVGVHVARQIATSALH